MESMQLLSTDCMHFIQASGMPRRSMLCGKGSANESGLMWPLMKSLFSRVWYRKTVLKLKAPGGKVYYIQCTRWRDKKQVCFLNTIQVGFSNELSVRRHVKGKATRKVIEGLRAQWDYVTLFNVVDRSD